MLIKTHYCVFDSSMFKYYELIYAGNIDGEKAWILMGRTSEKKENYTSHELFCGTEELCKHKLQTLYESLCSNSVKGLDLTV